MKIPAIIIALSFILGVADSRAQVLGGAFNPTSGPAVRLAVGEADTLSLNASFGVMIRGTASGASVTISGPAWAKIEPSTFSGGWGTTTKTIKVIIKSDTPMCVTSGPWIFGSVVGSDGSKAFMAYGLGPIIIYPRSSHGHVSIFTSSGGETLNFGQLRVHDSVQRSVTVFVDTTGLFGSFAVHDLSAPFSGPDSIVYSDCNSGLFSFRPTVSGHFVDTVHLVDRTTNDSLSLILTGEANVASVQEIDAPEFHLYPNPCDRVLNVSLPKNVLNEIEVWNLLGERVYSSQIMGGEIPIDCSRWLDGTYNVRIHNNDRWLYQRIVVTH